MNHQKQLYAAYAYSFFAFFGITQLWVIYLGQQGLSLVAIGLCESIFHVASFLSEVPSGVLADRFSYRTMLILSRGMSLISSAMMLINGGFAWFALSFIFSAWSYNLQSGTLEALLYESLLETDQKAHWPQVSSRLNIVIEIATTSGLLLAGTMVNWDLAVSYWLALGFAVLGILATLFLHEPRQHKQQETRQTISQIIREAIMVLRQQPTLRRLMVFDATVSAIAAAYYFYFQNVMTARHFSTPLITLLLAGTTVVAVLTIRLSPRLLKLNTNRLLAGVLGVLSLLLLLTAIGQTAVISGLFLLIYGLSALMPPVFTVLYNARIPSAQRATLLSVASLLYSLAMIGLFPLLGWAIQQIGFAWTFGACGGLLALASLIGWRRLGHSA